MAKKTVVVTRPKYDMPTTYLHYFCGKLLLQIRSVGEYRIIDLEKEKATKKIFEKAMKRKNIRLVILNGHGSKKSVCGHNNEEILNKDNVIILNSKIIYAVACDSSEELGEIAVSKGKADAYIGYESQFMVIRDPSKTATVTRDKNIRPFEQVYVTTMISLLSGLTVKESLEKTKERIINSIREYGTYGIRDNFGAAPLIRFALYWNLYFLKAHGDLDAVM